jgi:hypothetical protein
MNKTFSCIADTIRVEFDVEPSQEVFSIERSSGPESLFFAFMRVYIALALPTKR